MRNHIFLAESGVCPMVRARTEAATNEPRPSEHNRSVKESAMPDPGSIPGAVDSSTAHTSNVGFILLLRKPQAVKL